MGCVQCSEQQQNNKRNDTPNTPLLFAVFSSSCSKSLSVSFKSSSKSSSSAIASDARKRCFCLLCLFDLCCCDSVLRVCGRCVGVSTGTRIHPKSILSYNIDLATIGCLCVAILDQTLLRNTALSAHPPLHTNNTMRRSIARYNSNESESAGPTSSRETRVDSDSL
jgi:hypothetical protein